MASMDFEPIMEAWGQSPQWGRGAEPLVREQGGAKPPEGESFRGLDIQRKGQTGLMSMF